LAALFLHSGHEASDIEFPMVVDGRDDIPHVEAVEHDGFRYSVAWHYRYANARWQEPQPVVTDLETGESDAY
jgi:hypothetical protein